VGALEGIQAEEGAEIGEVVACAQVEAALPSLIRLLGLQ
jgi:hypothetical protein